MNTNDDADLAVAKLFGRPGTDRVSVAQRPVIEAAFRSAGFGPAEAARGASMLESGMYMGFEDVATSLVGFAHGHAVALVSPSSISEAAARLERGAVEISEPADGSATFVDGRRL